ncbi:MAG: class I SAM-dependent methyltransferase [Deltaproteobacteria bacterium]|nr:class I SAM-dependent methyltransferase [Deltaproteobacteria bacterium]
MESSVQNSTAAVVQPSWHCPICSAPHSPSNILFTLQWPEGPVDYFRCSCGMRYSSYAVKKSAPNPYDDSYYEHTRYAEDKSRMAYVSHLAEFFDTVLNQAMPSARVAMDVGCATGDFVAWLLKHGWNAHGMDISEAAVNKGRARGLPLKAAGIEELFHTPNQYDVITLWDVLEHVSDTKRTLAAIHTALKPGGFFLFKTVSCISVIEKMAEALYRLSGGRIAGPLKRMYVSCHLYFYTPDGLKRLLEQEGWTVLHTIQTDTPPAALFRSKLMRIAFHGISALHRICNRNYELLMACRKPSTGI